MFLNFNKNILKHALKHKNKFQSLSTVSLSARPLSVPITVVDICDKPTVVKNGK